MNNLSCQSAVHVCDGRVESLVLFFFAFLNKKEHLSYLSKGSYLYGLVTCTGTHVHVVSKSGSVHMTRMSIDWQAVPMAKGRGLVVFACLFSYDIHIVNLLVGRASDDT